MSTRTQRTSRVAFGLAICWPILAVPAPAQSPAEAEIAALRSEFQNAQFNFLQTLRQRTDQGDSRAVFLANDPGIVYMPRLLAFERAHAGDDVGLDALACVAIHGAGGAGPESAGFKARRELLPRMKPYENRELTMYVIAHLIHGDFDPQVLDYLHELAVSSEAHPTLRAFATLKFAQLVLATRASCQDARQGLQDASEGMQMNGAYDERQLRELLATLPPFDELEAIADEGITMLQELAASLDALRMPAYTADPKTHSIRIDVEKTKINATMADRASNLLFQERHLRTGRQSPDLDLKLVDGTPWKLADHAGRVVVIQFSYTGCGPCAAMYPDLHAMTKELGERVSVLTIMSDPTPDHALAAKESDKINWQVACDGSPGTVATRWAVDSFPTICVIDRDGKIAAVNLRGKQLRWKVEQLLAAKDN